MLRTTARIAFAFSAVGVAACGKNGNGQNQGDAGPDGSAESFTQIQLVAGKLGGAGYANGIGADARLGQVGDIVPCKEAVYTMEPGGVVRRLDPATNELVEFAMVQGEVIKGACDSSGAGRLLLAVRDATNVETIVALDLATKVTTRITGAKGDARKDGTKDQAVFKTIGALSVGPAGYAYIGESCDVREVDLSTGAVRLIAGSFTTCAGPMTSRSDDMDGTANGITSVLHSVSAMTYAPDIEGIYISTVGPVPPPIRPIIASSIVKIAPVGGAAKSCAVTTSFSDILDPMLPPHDFFGFATGLHYVSAGIAYATDGSVIRRVGLGVADPTVVAGASGLRGFVDDADGTASGIVSRFSGSGTLKGDAQNKTLYVADRNNYALRSLDLENNAVVTTRVGGTGAGFREDADSFPQVTSLLTKPELLEGDAASRRLWLVDGNGAWHLWRVDLADMSAHVVFDFAQRPKGLESATLSFSGLAVDAASEVAYLANVGRGIEVLSLKAPGHWLITLPEGGYAGLRDCAFDASKGFLYGLDAGDPKRATPWSGIYRVAAVTSFETDGTTAAERFWTSDAADADNLSAIAIDSTGSTLYYGGKQLVRIDVASQARSVLVESFPQGTVSGLAVSPDGTTVFASSGDAHVIYAVDAKTGATRVAAGIAMDKTVRMELGSLPLHLNNPLGLAAFGPTQLYFTSGAENAVLSLSR